MAGSLTVDAGSSPVARKLERKMWMEFVKTLEMKGSGKKKMLGTCLIRDGQLHFKVNETSMRVKEIGIVEGGIGMELERSEKQIQFIQCTRRFEEGDIPVNLQATGYSFSILAEKLSETEYVFRFENASMVKRKKRCRK